jgi:nucleoside 2-deoxyribosyltransferase
MSLVYLAGPITGLSWGNATDWRDHARTSLAKNGINGLSPLRAKDYLAKEDAIAVQYDNYVMSTGKGITTRDRWDCLRCDALLVNLIGAKKVSIGTMMELGWASAAHKPIILCMEDEGNPHDHAMVREVCGFVVNTLDHGIEVVKAMFS